MPIRTVLARFGGSHAQRDALQRNLVVSAIGSGQLDLVWAILDGRLGVRETSVWLWRPAGLGRVGVPTAHLAGTRYY